MARDRLESPEIYLISERKQNGMQEKGREITCENLLKKKNIKSLNRKDPY